MKQCSKRCVEVVIINIFSMIKQTRVSFRGLAVMTDDFESSNASSNLAGSFSYYLLIFEDIQKNRSNFKRRGDMTGSHLCVVQYDNRSEEKLGDQSLLMHRNEELCQRDSACSYFNLKYDADKPVYWEKVFAVSNVMEENPQCDVVAYIDSDAVMHTSPDVFTKDFGDSSFLMSNDPSMARMLSDELKDMMKLEDDDILPNEMFPPFNAGVWAVRNTSKGKEIMQEWKSLYDPSKWFVDETGEWNCGRGCKYAGENYEQGAFTTVIDKYSDDMQQDSWRVWNNRLCSDTVAEEANVCHFAGFHKMNISKYVEVHIASPGSGGYDRGL